ncbi:hypothetical protein FJT64_008326 [Amphibalanus amphitrite]|uniref:G-protein coupled receptors family 1 profile domain-containing protein n=1 Tax=Amphibalanus amphitrite TaxID=1232801 RepID=A0A6A4VVI8_AMPAM|nr:hypothetical protein FJT64_008326 [Amphibalanus amphitrite]
MVTGHQSAYKDVCDRRADRRCVGGTAGTAAELDTPYEMLYVWVKALVGLLLTINFAAPLYAVAVNRTLWEEPMAVLAANLSFSCMCLGVTFVLIGAYDIAQLQVKGLCQSLQYCGFGFGVAFKLAETCMAVDQFVAVFYPLQHYSLMSRARRWLFVATWLAWAVQPAFGLVAVLLELPTPADTTLGRDKASVAFPECRWESNIADAYAIFVETQFLVFSLLTAALYMYTGAVGYRMNARIRRQMAHLGHQNIGGRDRKFVDNFNSFKRIVWVFLTTMLLDVISPVVRLIGRWHPMPQFSGFLHQLRALCFICEGWLYGLLNAKLREAYKKTLCCRPPWELTEVNGTWPKTVPPVLVAPVLLLALATLVSLVPVAAFTGRRRLRGRCMFQLLANLAVCEHLTLALTLPVVALRHQVPRLPVAGCSALLAARSGLLLAESTALLCITAERHLAVIHGLRYFSLLTEPRRRLLLAAPWLAAAAGAAVSATGTSSHVSRLASRPACLYLRAVPAWLRLAEALFTIAIYQVIVALHVIIRRVAVRHSRQIARQRLSVGLSAEGPERMASYWGVFKAIGLNIAVTVPLCVLFTLESVGLHVPRRLIETFGGLSLLRSMLNGWIFGLWNEELRREYGWHCRSVEPSTADQRDEEMAERGRVNPSLLDTFTQTIERSVRNVVIA